MATGNRSTQPWDQKAQAARVEKMSVDDALAELATDPERGLDDQEAARRLGEYGPNAIAEKKRHPLWQFFKQFWGPIPWMIEIAAIFAAFLGRWEDFSVIALMLAINGGVGFWHESKASSAIEALKAQLSPKAEVIRGGQKKSIDAAELVPGDLIAMRLGDVVPADAKLLAGQQLNVDESSLTGESLPVDKGEREIVFSGTAVKRGEARAMVTATGGTTKFARTVELVQASKRTSHFQRAVLKIGYWLIGLVIVLDIVVLLYSIIVEHDPWTRVVLFIMVLTLGGIPAALPAVLSVTMSIGASRLARMKAIVSHLASMEEMAGLEILCSDKTGTLTLNKLTLQKPIVLKAQDEHDLDLAAALTCERDVADPIDTAVLNGFKDRYKVDELDGYETLQFDPFDPNRKRAEAQIRHNGQTFWVAKGAPQKIFDLVKESEEEKRRILQKVDELGEQGFRALGVARTVDSQDWQYLGILSILDPPREDSAEVIQQARDHGIDVRMVTGDHAAIARQVAGQIGMGTNILEVSKLFGSDEEAEDESKMSSPEVREKVMAADGFAQVTPEHKYHLVQAFQANDQIVGMTGDGVNDAAALHAADVGIAVSGATEAARAAADLVLTEKGLGVIIDAIEEARKIFMRMTSYAMFRITETMVLMLFISITILVFRMFPVTAIMVVLLSILNDIPILTIAWDNAAKVQRPVRWNMFRVLTTASVLSIVGVATTFLLYWYVRTQTDLSFDTIQTVMFLDLLVAGHLMIYITRAHGWFWQRPWPSWLLLLALEGTQVLGTLAAVYGWLLPGIGWTYTLLVWGYAIICMFIFDVFKVLTHWILGGHHAHPAVKAETKARLAPPARPIPRQPALQPAPVTVRAASAATPEEAARQSSARAGADSIGRTAALRPIAAEPDAGGARQAALLDRLRTTVRSHPKEAILLGLAAGTILGWFKKWR